MDIVSKNTASKINVSIIIAARNEEQNIEACLRSIIANDYKKETLKLLL
jgi:glycosyltransferase involved in cell wall biosynthesis